MPSARTATVWLPPAARVLAREKNTVFTTALVPLAVVTVTGPLCAPAGTTTPLMLVAVAAKPVVTIFTPALPAKVTVVVLARLVPVKVSTLPGCPMKGLRAVSVGAWARAARPASSRASSSNTSSSGPPAGRAMRRRGVMVEVFIRKQKGNQWMPPRPRGR